MLLSPLDPAYPARLRAAPDPPLLTLSGPLDAARVVAIVGSRRPRAFSRELAHELAYDLARAGVTIVSGGAEGVDTAAHRGALDAGGSTWVVAPCGRRYVAPEKNRRLFEAIERSERSRMIWPFSDHVAPEPRWFLSRNKVLVGLAELVVVVQARLRSGSRNAMGWAVDLGRPLWVVPGPLGDDQFSGSRDFIDRGAHPLHEKEELFAELGLRAPEPRSRAERRRLEVDRKPKRRAAIPTRSPLRPLPEDSWTDAEKTIFTALSRTPQHVDQVVGRTGLPTSTTVTALLTLSLKDVVVEGPDGFFRRALAG